MTKDRPANIRLNSIAGEGNHWAGLWYLGSNSALLFGVNGGQLALGETESVGWWRPLQLVQRGPEPSDSSCKLIGLRIGTNSWRMFIGQEISVRLPQLREICLSCEVTFLRGRMRETLQLRRGRRRRRLIHFHATTTCSRSANYVVWLSVVSS